MIAKMILPWFGGTAAVWTTCMLFFQLVLLAGYAYAHWSIKTLKPVQQAYLHSTLLGVSLLLLPITPGEGWKPLGGDLPLVKILLLLAGCVGLPYMLLSTTSPLIRTRRGAVPVVCVVEPRVDDRSTELSDIGGTVAADAHPGNGVVGMLRRLRGSLRHDSHAEQDSHRAVKRGFVGD